MILCVNKMKTMIIRPVNSRAFQSLMCNVFRLQQENKIVDYREFNNGIQILYKDDDDKLEDIKRCLYDNVHILAFDH